MWKEDKWKGGTCTALESVKESFRIISKTFKCIDIGCLLLKVMDPVPMVRLDGGGVVVMVVVMVRRRTRTTMMTADYAMGTFASL